MHTYKFAVDGRYQLDPVNPQRSVAGNGPPWSRFFTDASQVPLVLSRREREVLGRLVTHLLPFRLAENRQFIQEAYTSSTVPAGGGVPAGLPAGRGGGHRQLHRPGAGSPPEQHNADDYHTFLPIIDGLLRARAGGKDPLQLPIEDYAQLYGEMATDQVEARTLPLRQSPVLPAAAAARLALTAAARPTRAAVGCDWIRDADPRVGHLPQRRNQPQPARCVGFLETGRCSASTGTTPAAVS